MTETTPQSIIVDLLVPKFPKQEISKMMEYTQPTLLSSFLSGCNDKSSNSKRLTALLFNINGQITSEEYKALHDGLLPFIKPPTKLELMFFLHYLMQMQGKTQSLNSLVSIIEAITSYNQNPE